MSEKKLFDNVSEGRYELEVDRLARRPEDIAAHDRRHEVGCALLFQCDPFVAVHARDWLHSRQNHKSEECGIEKWRHEELADGDLFRELR